MAYVVDDEKMRRPSSKPKVKTKTVTRRKTGKGRMGKKIWKRYKMYYISKI